MNGIENLRPCRTKEDAKARGRNGGISSGRSRRRKKQLKDILEQLLQKRNAEGVPYGVAMCLALVERAAEGDVKAFCAIRDSTEGKPTQRTELAVEADKINFSWNSLSPEEICAELISQQEEEIRREKEAEMKHVSSNAISV